VKPKRRAKAGNVIVAVFAHPDAGGSVFLLLSCGHWMIVTTVAVERLWSDERRDYGSLICARCVLPSKPRRARRG
jgi:hypothetical protein